MLKLASRGLLGDITVIACQWDAPKGVEMREIDGHWVITVFLDTDCIWDFLWVQVWIRGGTWCITSINDGSNLYQFHTKSEKTKKNPVNFLFINIGLLTFTIPNLIYLDQNSQTKRCKGLFFHLVRTQCQHDPESYTDFARNLQATATHSEIEAECTVTDCGNKTIQLICLSYKKV